MIQCVDQLINDRFAIYQGDSCEVIRAIPGDSIHFGIHSPPFEGLYRFSNYDRDISNNEGSAFWEHYAFLIQELHRVTILAGQPTRSPCGCRSLRFREPPPHLPKRVTPYD